MCKSKDLFHVLQKFNEIFNKMDEEKKTLVISSKQITDTTNMKPFHTSLNYTLRFEGLNIFLAYSFTRFKIKLINYSPKAYPL